MIQTRTIVVAAIFAFFGVLATVYAVNREPDPNDERLPALDSHATSATGARAIIDWLNELGYAAQRLEWRDYELDGATRAMLLLAPTQPMDDDRLGKLRGWLNNGGTLIFAVRSTGGAGLGSLLGQSAEPLLAALGVDARVGPATSAPTLVFPVGPPNPRRLQMAAGWTLSPRANPTAKWTVAGALTPVVVSGDQTLIGVVPVGRGRVWVIADGEWLANNRLANADNSQLLLAMLGGVAPGPRNVVLVDEWHRGYHRVVASLGDALFESAWGRSVLAAIVLVWLYLALSGRRFGRPVTVVEFQSQVRRSTGELVTSMAQIFRKARQRDWALRAAADQTCQRLARLYGLNPNQPAPALVEALARLDRLAPETLRDLRLVIERAGRGRVEEAELFTLGKSLAEIERRVREGRA